MQHCYSAAETRYSAAAETLYSAAETLYSAAETRYSAAETLYSAAETLYSAAETLCCSAAETLCSALLCCQSRERASLSHFTAVDDTEATPRRFKTRSDRLLLDPARGRHLPSDITLHSL